MLNSNIKQQSVKLSDTSFLRLLFLINTLLSSIDMQNGADYIIGKVIMEISGKVHHEVDNDGKEPIKETMEQFLKHPYFESFDFWEEYFWDTIPRKFQQKFGVDIGEDYSKREKDWLATQLNTFRDTLTERGLPKDTITSLINRMATDIKIDITLLDKINTTNTNKKNESSRSFFSPRSSNTEKPADTRPKVPSLDHKKENTRDIVDAVSPNGSPSKQKGKTSVGAVPKMNSELNDKSSKARESVSPVVSARGPSKDPRSGSKENQYKAVTRERTISKGAEREKITSADRKTSGIKSRRSNFIFNASDNAPKEENQSVV